MKTQHVLVSLTLVHITMAEYIQMYVYQYKHTNMADYLLMYVYQDKHTNMAECPLMHACQCTHTKTAGIHPVSVHSVCMTATHAHKQTTQAQQMGGLTIQAWPIIRTHSRLNIWTPSIKGVMKIRIIINKLEEIALL